MMYAQKSKTNLVIATTLLLIWLISPTITSAQTAAIAPPGVDEQVSVTIDPKIPGPNEVISIFIESFSADFNKSYITWKVNGITKSEGAGVTHFSLKNGALGTRTTVGVTVETSDSRVIEKSFVFEPASVNLLYEAQTYTPPFYKGKPLFTPQSTLKVVAMPEFIKTDGTRINPENLVYTWKKDETVLQDQSGFGKQYALIETNAITRPMYITLDVTAVGSNLKGTQTIYVTPREQELVMYEDSPLYGTVWSKALGDIFYLGRNAFRIKAEPYFFSTDPSGQSDIKYTWGMNADIINLPKNQNTIGLRNETGDSGSANVTVIAEHESKFVQSAEKKILIDYSELQ